MISPQICFSFLLFTSIHLWMLVSCYSVANSVFPGSKLKWTFTLTSSVITKDQEKALLCSFYFYFWMLRQSMIQMTRSVCGNLYSIPWWLRQWRVCLQTQTQFCAGNLGSIPGFRKIPWVREWLPTSEFLLGEFYGQRSLAGYSPWGRKELDVTEQWTLSLSLTSEPIVLLEMYYMFTDNRNKCVIYLSSCLLLTWIFLL